MSENDLNELSWYENGVVGRKMSILARLVWIMWQFVPILDQFWHPKTQNWGNQLSEVSENDLNEFSWLENRVVGRKMSILAHLVWIIWQFVSILTHFGPILAPLDPKLGGTNYWRCLNII